MRRIRSTSGMNYIQMLLILAVAGIAAALVVPYLTSRGEEEALLLAREKLVPLAEAQEEYYKTHGEFTMEIDSLMTILPDPEAFVDPVSGDNYIIEVVNMAQEYSIYSPADNKIRIVTEDRWDNLASIRQAWHEYQLQERERARSGRR